LVEAARLAGVDGLLLTPMPCWQEWQRQHEQQPSLRGHAAA
jgi:hypothetical protein